MFIINRMDAENANFDRTIEQLRDKFGTSVVPVLLPIGEGTSFTGVVNVLENKAYSGKGKDLKEIPVPAVMASAIESATAEITEAAAEAVDELLEKYFEEGELSHEEPQFRQSRTRNGSFFCRLRSAHGWRAITTDTPSRSNSSRRTCSKRFISIGSHTRTFAPMLPHSFSKSSCGAGLLRISRPLAGFC